MGFDRPIMVAQVFGAFSLYFIMNFLGGLFRIVYSKIHFVRTHHLINLHLLKYLSYGWKVGIIDDDETMI
jgi:hypothetical protein